MMYVENKNETWVYDTLLVYYRSHSRKVINISSE
jgi:hypothetical protein